MKSRERTFFSHRVSFTENDGVLKLASHTKDYQVFNYLLAAYATASVLSGIEANSKNGKQSDDIFNMI